MNFGQISSAKNYYQPKNRPIGRSAKRISVQAFFDQTIFGEMNSNQISANPNFVQKMFGKKTYC